MSGELGKALARQLIEEMPRNQLETHIVATLKEVRLCTLVTSRDDIPRGTPLEFFSEGLMLYITPDPGTKTRNLEVNPNVSVSIYNTPFPDWENDWQNIWGMQITGQGELLREGDPGYQHACQVIDLGPFLRALGTTERPSGFLVLRITPSKIELRDFRLIGRGYSRKQVWQAGS